MAHFIKYLQLQDPLLSLQLILHFLESIYFGLHLDDLSLKQCDFFGTENNNRVCMTTYLTLVIIIEASLGHQLRVIKQRLLQALKEAFSR